MNKIIKIIIEVIFIIIIVAAGYYGLSKITTKISKNTVAKEVLVTFEAQAQTQEIVEKMRSGDKIYDSTKANYLGEVVSLSDIYPYKALIRDFTANEYADKDVEGFYNRDLTVKINADVSDMQVMIGETDLKVGLMLYLRNPEYVVEGLIVKIEVL